MRRWLRRIAWGLGISGVLSALAIGFCGLAYYSDMRIDRARGIDEAGYVEIGGVPQWIQIRGDDRTNPVILLLHGGPGFTMIPETPTFRAWERSFTLAIWDQRGAGKSFEASGAAIRDTMTLARLTGDGVEVAEYLRTRLNKKAVVLLGHSWGSLLGAHIAQARPDLFAAYVGTGQLLNERETAAVSYPLVLARARAWNDRTATAALAAAGMPPWPDDIRHWIPWLIEAQALDSPADSAARTTPAALWTRFTKLFDPHEVAPGITPAMQFSMESLWPDLLAADVPSLGTRYRVPVVLIQGAEDITTPTALARAWFGTLDAPAKRFVSLPGAGHLAMYRASGRFLEALNRDVRPLALAAELNTGRTSGGLR